MTPRGGRPLVIAHRGASGERPENTLPAYELAIEQRADMIEIDLHLTRDGEIAITHDESLTGIGGRGEIADAGIAEIQALDAGGGERVPSLDQVLDAFAARIPFNLEIKRGGAGDYAGLERRTLEALERRELGASILFSSFYDTVLARIREAAPSARLGVLVSPRAPERWLERAAAIGAEAVHFWKGLASEEGVERAHGAGLAVYCYTVDAEAEMQMLLERGVDGLFTNWPARMRALVDSKYPGGPRSG